MSIVVCIFGKMARPRHTTHVRLVIRQCAITAAIAVSRGLEGPRQRGVSSHRIATLIRSVAKAIGTPAGSGRSSTMEAPLSPPLPSFLASSRQVTPDGHVAEAQPLGDLSDGQALLAEEDRLGTVFVGEAVVAFQSCLPAQPVDR